MVHVVLLGVILCLCDSVCLCVHLPVWGGRKLTCHKWFLVWVWFEAVPPPRIGPWMRHCGGTRGGAAAR